VELEEPERNSTLLRYEAELQVGGRLASVGQRLLDTVGKSMIRQSFEALNQQLEARLSPANTGAMFHAPPTSSQFTKGVVKEVIKESFRTHRVLWIVVGVVLIVFILRLLF